MVKLNENELLESKDLRVQLLERIEILSKVKEIITLPNTELLTTKMVAEYYEVSQDVIRDNIRRNEDELKSNGMVLKKYGEVKDLIGSEFDDLGSENISLTEKDICDSLRSMTWDMGWRTPEALEFLRMIKVEHIVNMAIEVKKRNLDKDDWFMNIEFE